MRRAAILKMKTKLQYCLIKFNDICTADVYYPSGLHGP